MNISLSYYSDIGKRKNNEDAVSVSETAKGLLAIVADGLGGMGNGEFASQQAVRVIKDLLSDGEVTSDSMEAAIVKAHEEVHSLQYEHPGAHSTVAAVWLGEGFAYAMHVGDSRIYQFRNNAVLYQSVDHSMAQCAVMSGELRPEEIRTHPSRNKLTQALGSPNPSKVAHQFLELRKYDRLLICSDGFWEKILETEMLETAQQTYNAEEWLYQMRAIAQPTARDNNTSIAIVING